MSEVQTTESETTETEEDLLEEYSSEMPLTAHLAELRSRLLRCVIAVIVGFAACYSFSEQMFQYLIAPMQGVLHDGHFQFTHLPEAFYTYLKISLVAGTFVVSPYLFWQVWGFIAPGLYEHERKWMVPLALISAMLFTGGAMFGYFIVFPFGFDFFASFANDQIQLIPKLDEYTGFTLKLLFAFGMVFEMPLFIFFLSRLGLVTSKGLRAKRKYAILVSFIVAAILTPPDPFTQSLMAGPLVILYEAGIWIAYFFGTKEEWKEKRRLKKEQEREAKLQAELEASVSETVELPDSAEKSEEPSEKDVK